MAWCPAGGGGGGGGSGLLLLCCVMFSSFPSKDGAAKSSTRDVHPAADCMSNVLLLFGWFLGIMKILTVGFSQFFRCPDFQVESDNERLAQSVVHLCNLPVPETSREWILNVPEVYWESIFVVLPCFSGYAALFGLQHEVKVPTQISSKLNPGSALQDVTKWH